MTEITNGVTRSGLMWLTRGGRFFYVRDGQERPWPVNWPTPRTSLEPTAAEKRRAENRESRHREALVKIARLREAARKSIGGDRDRQL